MSDLQFLRVWKVTAFTQSNSDTSFFEERSIGFEVTELRTQFKIVKSLDKTPNTCELTISNLNEESRGELARRPLRVKLEAGYDNVPHLLYVGDVGQSPGSRYEGTEWETKLLLGDGLRAFAHARINRSYKKGTTVLSILKDAAASMGAALPAGLASDPALRAQIPAGDVMAGYSSDELTRQLAAYGYGWSFQNGVLQVLKDEQSRSDRPKEVSEDTGMVDAPKVGNPEKKGQPAKVTVKMLLNPELIPGGLVEIKSRSLNGVYKITQVTHDGDSHGDSWHTEVECVKQTKK